MGFDRWTVDPYPVSRSVGMGWFSKDTDGKATGADAMLLRDAFAHLLEFIEGELPRADAKRVQELRERLASFPVPTGLERQSSSVLKALRGTAVGAGSADFSDAARALVDAMQRVTIHDSELTTAIHSLGESVPLRMRNGDARLLEVNAREIQKSAQGARFRQTQANEAVFTLLNTLEMNLGKALEATSDLEDQLAQVRVSVEGMGEGTTLTSQKEAVLVSLSRMADANTISRSRVDQGIARVRELSHHIRSQSGDVSPSAVRVTIDSLTQVADRVAFLEALPLALVEARHAGGMLTCMRLNVDEMKRINEDYHQSSGDDVLRTVASTIVQQLRTEDFVARISGDDFAALLPNTGNREATGAAKRLGRKVSKMIFTHQQQTFQVSISIGIATWDGKESAESLYARADTALSRAKKNGGAQYWASQTHQLG